MVERIVPERVAAQASHQSGLRSELNLLIGMGGREHTRRELTALLRIAGFGEPRYADATASFLVIEATKR